jgi:hypothetical protein
VQAAGQPRTDARQRHAQVRPRIGRAADDAEQRLAGHCLDLAQAQAISIRMRASADDARDDDVIERPCHGLDGADLDAGHGQALGNAGGVERRIAPLAQPGFADSHRTAA